MWRSTIYKLMGTGLNGSFDLRPDIKQWTIMSFHDQLPANLENAIQQNIKTLFGNFIAGWIRFFRCETGLFVLEIKGGHGNWDAHPVFKDIPKISQPSTDTPEFSPVAILTRATIRFRSIKAFWQQVPVVNSKVRKSTGLLFSIGTGEMPVIRQATFSVWESLYAMKHWAYTDPDHLLTIQRTRDEAWYSEELFLRMKILFAKGSVKGSDLHFMAKEKNQP
jgi:hypothetical protein